MKNIFIILSILLFSGANALDIWSNGINGNRNYYPYYGFNNRHGNITNGARLLNNLRMLGYNTLLTPPPLINNYYPYNPNINNVYNRHPRYAHFKRHWGKFPKYPGHLTGFTPPVTESLPKCETNSYYVNPQGEISCNHEVKSSTTVRIIDD